MFNLNLFDFIIWVLLRIPRHEVLLLKSSTSTAMYQNDTDFNVLKLSFDWVGHNFSAMKLLVCFNFGDYFELELKLLVSVQSNRAQLTRMFIWNSRNVFIGFKYGFRGPIVCITSLPNKNVTYYLFQLWLQC